MMSTRLIIVTAFLVCSAHANNAATSYEGTSILSIGEMQQVFDRSEKVHVESMNTILKGMSPQKAWQVLEKSNLTTPALIEMAGAFTGKQARLRKQPKGYSGLDGARKLLNDMIFESMTKYDAEIAKCTAYYAQQCAGMEACRGQIAASNYIAANSRTLILGAQATINKMEVDIPTQKMELSNHNRKCKAELKKLSDRLKIVLADIEVMTIILKMTDCESKKFVQMQKLALLHCQDPCSKKSFITFNQDDLKHQVSQLQSSVGQKLIQENFKDLFEGVESLESIELLQVEAPIINKTKFNNPPVPRTKVPSNPCNDPNGGAPSAADKRAAKCTIKKSPQCYKLQERFLNIQSGIKDERDDLLEETDRIESFCEMTRENLETQIQNDQDMLSNAQTQLGDATTKESTAAEKARQTAAENEQLNDDLKKQMKTCSANYINFETELCALKKIRGELYKMKGDGHSAFFQDCEVAKWDPEECTKKCKGGEQKLTRSVMTHPNGGAKCLPLAAMRKCNLQPCPVNCKLKSWSGWSKCSAECGGGVQQRLREVKMAMRHGGKPCGATSQSRACNGQACEKDCVLGAWTKWSGCSKDCDGGTRKRERFVFQNAEGAGKCPGKWSKKRLQFKKCNFKRCMVESADKALACNKTLDVLFLLDGSGSLGKRGWTAEMKAAHTFVDAFNGAGADTNMAVILYSGPRTWSGVRKCVGRNKKKIDMEKTCKIKMVTHFTKDLKKVDNLITGLTWPRGSTLTSLALLTAKAELALGRKSAKSIAVIITDGRPLSFRATHLASRSLRKSARLIWVPVTRYAPLKWIKRWATRRWQENVVKVNSFNKLAKPEVVTHIVANICPKGSQALEFGRK